MAKYNDIIEGLRIFATMDPAGGPVAEHDTIYAGVGVSPEALSPDTLKTLDDMGWHFDAVSESWLRYV